MSSHSWVALARHVPTVSADVAGYQPSKLKPPISSRQCAVCRAASPASYASVGKLTGPRGDGYRRMIEHCPAGRAGTPDEVGTLAALLMSPAGAFITGSDFLIDGGVTASYFYGELAPT